MDNNSLWSTPFRRRAAFWVVWVLVLLVALPACQRGDEASETTTVAAPTAVAEAVETVPAISPETPDDFIVVAMDAPNAPFTDFDEFGEVTGFAADFMAAVAEEAGLDYEFVVTPYQGVLASIASNANEDFDVVMPPEPVPDTAVDTEVSGIAYTEPYLEVGQVVVVLANETELQQSDDLRSGTAVGVAQGSDAEVVAREQLGIADSDLFLYEQPSRALQALAEESVRAVVVNSFMGSYIATQYAQQFKLLGGGDPASWLDSEAYAIALSAENEALLARLNEAITAVVDNNRLTDLAATWFVDTAAIDAGESRVGTPANELVIGVAAPLVDLDPAGDPANPPNLLSWEVKMNIMAGLYAFNEVNELVPLLAADFPTISEDGLTYTIPLRTDLTFPDGRAFTAEDVKWSLNRAGRLGNFQVNRTLQDSNDDNFADATAVEVVDTDTVRIVLQAPLGSFINLLATPPFFPISRDCFSEALDLLSQCGGMGPYRVVAWEQGERLRLTANAEWPGEPQPAFENIQLRFYDDSAGMRTSLAEYQSVDMAWYGLPYSDLQALEATDLDSDGLFDFSGWEGTTVFKSYLIFNHDAEPWDNPRVREAANLALDRTALAESVFEDSRQPLFSPVPLQVPGAEAVFPTRDLARARQLLRQAGYSETTPAAVTLTFIDDGRYSDREAQYAEAIKAQLEETEVFQVTLESAPWEIYRLQIAECGYPFYLMGWPSPGRPVDYLAVPSWTDFFIENTTAGFCSNYESNQMEALLAEARETTETAARLAVYGEMQTLWAEELPTADLLAEPGWALSLDYVDGVRFDGLGLMQYPYLSKEQP